MLCSAILDGRGAYGICQREFGHAGFHECGNIGSCEEISADGQRAFLGCHYSILWQTSAQKKEQESSDKS